MAISLNCFILGESTNTIFETDLGDEVVLDNIPYDINKLKISKLKEYIFKKQKLETYTDNHRNLNLWKVNVSEDELEGVYTEYDVKNKLNGTLMSPNKLFRNREYFPDNLSSDAIENIHIILVPPVGQCMKTVEDIIEIILKDSMPLTSQTLKASQFDWQEDMQDMPLKDRNLSNSVVTVRKNLINNLRVRLSHPYAKADSNILVCGIGKTRFGKELFNNIQTNGEKFFGIDHPELRFEYFEYLYLDFGSSIRLDEQDYFLDNEVIICLRILYKHFVMGKYELSFDIFRERALPYIKILNTQGVFESIRKSLSFKGAQRLFVFLHIDEYQLIFKWDEKRENKLIKYIVGVFATEYMLGNGSHLTFVQEFLSGTALQAVLGEKEASKVSFEPINVINEIYD